MSTSMLSVPWYIPMYSSIPAARGNKVGFLFYICLKMFCRFLARSPDFDSQLAGGWWREVPGDVLRRVLEERSDSLGRGGGEEGAAETGNGAASNGAN